MRSSGLVLMGVAALLLVGYAFYTLLSPSPPRSGAGRSRGEAASRNVDDEPTSGDEEDEEGKVRARRPRPRGATKGQPETRPAVAIDAAPSEAGAPPRPTPKVPLDEARKSFADYMAELDGLEARGVELTSPEWVDHYKRGHELLLPLQQHLDWKEPEQAEELRRANEDMRTRLDALQPGRPDPPPSP
jgi:hypothetical protein